MSTDKHFLTELRQILDGSGDDSASSSSELNDFLSHLAEEHSMDITLSGEDGFSKTKTLPFTEGSCTFSDISPGKYQLTLSNGRVLWQGQLKEEYLILENDIPLKMAADTEANDGDITSFFELIPAECEMRVFAGLESGSVKIKTM